MYDEWDDEQEDEDWEVRRKRLARPRLLQQLRSSAHMPCVPANHRTALCLTLTGIHFTTFLCAKGYSKPAPAKPAGKGGASGAGCASPHAPTTSRPCSAARRSFFPLLCLNDSRRTPQNKTALLAQARRRLWPSESPRPAAGRRARRGEARRSSRGQQARQTNITTTLLVLFFSLKHHLSPVLSPRLSRFALIPRTHTSDTPQAGIGAARSGGQAAPAAGAEAAAGRRRGGRRPAPAVRFQHAVSGRGGSKSAGAPRVKTSSRDTALLS